MAGIAIGKPEWPADKPATALENRPRNAARKKRKAAWSPPHTGERSMTTMNNEDPADPNVHEARGLDCGMNKPSNARLTAPDTAHRSDDER